MHRKLQTVHFWQHLQRRMQFERKVFDADKLLDEQDDHQEREQCPDCQTVLLECRCIHGE